MAYKIVVTGRAKEDTQAAYDHYENERQGLGEEFLSEHNTHKHPKKRLRG